MAAKLGINIDYTAKGSVQEGKINGKSNFILILAGNAIIFEKGFLFELGYALNSISVEEIVEEKDVIFGETEMADFPHFV